MKSDKGENWDDFFYMRDKDGSYQKVPLDHFGCNIPTLYLLVVVGTVVGFLIYFAYLAIVG